MKETRIKEEYTRVKELFAEIEEKQKMFLDDIILIYAKIKVELEELEEIKKESGVIKVHPTDFSKQKE